MRGRSIVHRISMLLGLAIFTAVALVTAISSYGDVTSDFAQRKRALEATGYVFASALADHVAQRNEQESLRVLRSISRLPDITYAAVVGNDGNAFASFGGTAIMSNEALKSDIGLMEAIRTGVYPVAVDIIKSGQRIGQVILIANVSDLSRQLLNALLTSLAIAVIAIGVSFAIAKRLLSRITGPILSLTGAIQDIRATRRYQGLGVHQAGGETGVLIDSFNAMIEEISSRDDALEKQRQNLESTVEQRTLELRHARDAAESANEAKSSFLATMSHEIRTPLNGLMVMAELLAGAGLDQRLQRYAEVIVKSGQSLLTIINDILDLSKIEAGKLQLECIPVNPAGVADDVTSLFWEKASSKGLDLAARVAPGMPGMVLADPVRLNQILSNLVNNALKFTERGHVLISLQYEAGHLTMAVTDSGIGIPRKKLDQLFQAFSQADQTITRKFGSTGLGLAICKRLAEAMDGAIGVRSELGKGSTFWVRIPLAVSAPAVHAHYPPRRAAIAIDGLAS
ncbi:ATP-binding protein, partial [Aestuariivirga sp.]|uniref:ATP-binding protein n=1 Tax=Aestuariivirga sp. TaxID=2650926 RepID=UPI003593D081